MNDKLDLILEGIKELQQITRAIHDRQEETDAKLEALAMEVHKLHGEVASVKEDTKRIHKRLDYQILRIARTEEEIHLLKPEKQ
ncbi:hypothetical protein [Aneurinibacillus aneurinilyticus]|uniref:Uncharacterized protein n=1 Tax=Aneurinibacillus aneurinilyticus ATCC 12856 TaxID=649747 RepID=U1YG63_ANEAE|nr:hypothetical protein [Aneurinibacillus aneurinilyticus]ERI09756.1 hypothetical protein HMPREF0083_02120 [Aneurinibacillus aneurinilyticus ATCC 12856]MED0672680.1 hypothetical protein [Aneurinibacillus aneurinilyticus]MED0707114.1 hypothetical protein [Aneurinibacillus aneurinilyticus]MED0732817.1 hypothetical protein [Aneurinibacillus aneurinilyticus]MED0740413.1 hypothetical protein [Aneurinibacillus aneurinilyticus]